MVECAADGDGLVEVAEDGGRVDSVVAGISDEDVGIKNVQEANRVVKCNDVNKVVDVFDCVEEDITEEDIGIEFIDVVVDCVVE